MRNLALTSLSLLVVCTTAATLTGCSAFGGDDADEEGPAAAAKPAEAPKAPPVTGSPNDSELTEAFGVFVSPNGSDDGPGDRARPLRTISAGIAHGKRLGKRVYVCSGTFSESIVLADSISIIGALDCSRPDWKQGYALTRIEAPASPAMRAIDISSATRLEGLDVVAPNAAAPSGSSVGLIAERAPGLTIARSKITAGDAAKGDDGTNGTQLVGSGTIHGQGYIFEAECVDGTTCTQAAFSRIWFKPKGGHGGTNVCAGEPGHDGEAGGDGGSGGLFEIHQNGPVWLWRFFEDKVTNGPEIGVFRTGASGAPGADGANAGALGAFSAEGYAPANGAAGANGEPGKGGYGGRGVMPARYANTVNFAAVWRGNGGAGGGAGGCPGLAGSPGKGGGASIAALLLESPVTIEGTDLVAGRGGDGGRGTLGSLPTQGGMPGYVAPGVDPIVAGAPGGNGGAAGVSGNGAPGPSIAIAHKGAAPNVLATSTLAVHDGGAAIDGQTNIDAFGNVKTIPASPAGVSKGILAL